MRRFCILIILAFLVSACGQKAENKLGDEVFSSPTICGGRIYLRVAERQGDVRQEMLYCIGEK